MYSHIKAVETLRAANGTLPVNLKFLIEGEEEVGGISVAEYVAKNAAKLKATVTVATLAGVDAIATAGAAVLVDDQHPGRGCLHRSAMLTELE